MLCAGDLKEEAIIPARFFQGTVLQTTSMETLNQTITLPANHNQDSCDPPSFQPVSVDAEENIYNNLNVSRIKRGNATD